MSILCFREYLNIFEKQSTENILWNKNSIRSTEKSTIDLRNITTSNTAWGNNNDPNTEILN